jgi:hypothetical protein
MQAMSLKKVSGTFSLDGNPGNPKSGTGSPGQLPAPDQSPSYSTILSPSLASILLLAQPATRAEAALQA